MNNRVIKLIEQKVFSCAQHANVLVLKEKIKKTEKISGLIIFMGFCNLF
jgi:hypothetical protein